MVRGLPIVGSFLEWRRDHVGVFRRAYERNGPVFGIKLGPQRGVVLIGPRYHDFFFKNVDGLLSVPELYRFVIPMFGEVMMAARDTATRRSHVELLRSAFQGGRLASHTTDMAKETTRWLDRLGDDGSFDVWDAFEPLSMRVGASALLGPEILDRIAEFRPLLADLARGMDFVLPPNLPLPKFRRRDRARRLLTEMIGPVLVERRRHPSEREDFLQTMTRDPVLREAGDDAMIGMALMTLFTGYLTTAAQMSWALVLLLRHADHLRAVVDEVDEVRAGDDLPHGVRLARLDRAIKEAVRLRPVMSHYARTTTRDYELDGYRVPRGWLTILCPGVAHRLPEIFADPDVYDPDRFAPDRAEDKRHPHALIGFSGGFYRCPGSAFGTAEIRTVIGMLVARYSLELVDGVPPGDFEMGVIRPASPCRVRFRKRARR